MCVYIKREEKKVWMRKRKVRKRVGECIKKSFLRGKERKGVGESVCVCVSV